MMTDNRVGIFISYAHEDREFLSELEAHLGALRRQDYISVWSHHEVNTGIEWEHEIERHLDAAQIILLLISPDYMFSERFYGYIMKRAMEPHEQGTARVIPILLRPYLWEKTPLAQLDILPRNRIPIEEFQDPDEAFCNIAIELRYVVENLLINKRRDEGNELYRQGNYSEALAVYEQIFRLKNSLATTIDIGTVLIDLQRYEEALYIYDKYMQALNPYKQSLRTKTFTGDSPGYNRKFYEEALQVYEQIFQQSLSSSSHWPGMILTDVPSLSTGVDQSVINRLNQAIQHNPINPFLYHLKGNVYFRLEQYREALGAYEQAIELQEGFELSYKYLSAAIEKISQEEYEKLNSLARYNLERANQIRDKKDNYG